MTINEAIVEANSGNVEAMLAVADFYAKSEELGNGMEMALQWYEKAAETGNVYGMEMAGITYMISASTSLAIGAFADSLEEWNRAFEKFHLLVQYEGYSLEKKRDIKKKAQQCIYKTIYCNVLLKRYEDALYILERISFKNVSKEMMLKGICLYHMAEETENYEEVYDILRYFESKSALSCLKDASNELEEMILSEGYIALSLFYRIGIAGVERDIDRAYSLLSMVADKIKGKMADEFIQEELSHYKKKLFGGYKYIK